MSDDTIGTIEGTATYEKVAVWPSEHGSKVKVKGEYGDSETTYKAPLGAVYIGGIEIDLLHDEFWLTPDDDFLWVESTGDELHITKEKP